MKKRVRLRIGTRREICYAENLLLVAAHCRGEKRSREAEKQRKCGGFDFRAAISLIRSVSLLLNTNKVFSLFVFFFVFFIILVFLLLFKHICRVSFFFLMIFFFLVDFLLLF